MFTISIILGCFVCYSAGSKGSGWSYDDPSKWKDTYPNCGGNKQSPIDIQQSKVTCNESLSDLLSFSNFDKVGSGNFTIENNGHSCVVSSSSADAETTIKGGDTFKLLQFHFHWGSDDSKGSEHLLDGEASPVELHLVHYNSKYASFAEAKNKNDGLAVIGVFIEVGKENAAFNKFLDLNVTEDGSQKEFSPFAVNDVLPEDKNDFYHYSGSLTTPTCDQSVFWYVMGNKIQISQAQLDKLRILKTKNGQALVNNFRPPQPLDGRKLWASFKAACPENGASSFKASIAVLVLSFLLFF